jgi:hypothetical protein
MVPGFGCSAANKASGLIWNVGTFDPMSAPSIQRTLAAG